MLNPLITLNDSNVIPQLGFGVFQVPPDDTQRIVEEAFAVGYRHIDTAAGYHNEAGVGRALKASGLSRDEVFITTKLYNDSHGYQETLEAFEVSMAELDVDYLDLYLIHWPRPKADHFVESWHAFEALQAAGSIHSIGVSNFRIPDLEKLATNSAVIPVINQIELHPHFQQEELREYHAAHDIRTEAWSPIGQGSVLDEPLLAEIGSQYGKSPAQVAIRWHLDIGNIVIPKSADPGRMTENFAVFDFHLSEKELVSIRGLETGQRIGFDPSEFEGYWD